jgi:ferredoxin-type protein NapG
MTRAVLTRRRLLGVTGALMATAALTGSLRVRAASSRWLRPPGALAPGAFERACIRCFRCAEVCPPGCITFSMLLPPLEADTPFIDADKAGCILCMRCTEACPTGALVRIEPKAARLGVPALDKTRCIAWNGGPCRLCFDVCPLQGSAVRLDDRLAPRFLADACTGCGLCQAACPVDEKAIRIRPVGATA